MGRYEPQWERESGPQGFEMSLLGVMMKEVYDSKQPIESVGISESVLVGVRRDVAKLSFRPAMTEDVRPLEFCGLPVSVDPGRPADTIELRYGDQVAARIVNVKDSL